MKKTKIICSIGPASSSLEIMSDLALAGMDEEAINASKTLLTVLKENTVATTD